MNRPLTWLLAGSFLVLAFSGLSGFMINTLGQVIESPGPGATLLTAMPDEVVSEAGSLFVTNDTSYVANHQCLGGVECAEIQRINLHAVGESVLVQSIQIVEANSTNSHTVNALNIYNAVGNGILAAVATVGACGTTPVPVPGHTFCATFSGSFLVTPGLNRVLSVRPILNNDSNGALPNVPINYYVYPNSFTGSSVTSLTVRARGVTTGLQLKQNNGDPFANGEVFIGRLNPGPNLNTVVSTPSVSVLSKIINVTNAHPAPYGSPIPIAVADIAMFRFTAAPNNNTLNGLNKVVVKDILFSMDAENAALQTGGFKLYNTNNSQVVAACSAINWNTGQQLTGTSATGIFAVKCENLTSSQVSTTIDPGTALTFALRANVMSTHIVPANPSSLQVTFSYYNQIGYQTFGLAGSSIRWVDQDNGAPTTATFLWLDLYQYYVNSTFFQN